MKPTFLASSLLILTAGAMGADGNFERKIGPLLAEKCLDCHNSREREGGLDLSLKTAAFSGGDSGTVIVPGKLAESLLWDRISADEMPPKHPLTVDEKQSIRSWIEQGAPWDGERIDPFAYSTGKRAGYDWWSLQRLSDPVPPRTTEKQHPVDAFVQRKLVEHGLAPSPPADRRTLIRRLSFSLTGLPPTPDEVKTFSSDPSPDAYQRLVDRLLDSPHYGERWARHWLDLARFGESQGFERDKLRENAWPYRDWVIQALNADMPYDEFATKQIAGDVLQPGESESIVATGFLVAGPYDEVGQSQQSAAMRAVVRQDEMEDYIGTVCQTFLGLTVNCARCHDHKFDPISQTEYYQIAAALAGVRAGERPYQTKEDRQSLQSARDQLANVQHEIDSLLAPIREQILNERESNLSADDVPRPIARWTFETGFNDEIGQHHGTAHGAAEIVDGQLLLNGTNAYVSTSPLETSIQAKTLEAWVQLDSLTQRGGGVISVQTTDGNVFDAIVFGEREPQQWMAGSNGFVRSQPFHGPKEEQADKTLVHVAIVYDEDGTIHAYRNGEPYGRPYQSSGAETYSPGQSQVLFGLRHGTAAGGNRLLAGRIEQAQLYDRALSAAEIAASSSQFGILSRAHLLTKMTPEQTSKLEQWETQVKTLIDQIRSLENRRVYAVTPRPPEATHVLLRGNPGSPVEVVQPMGIASIQGLSPDFELTPDAKEEDRRRKLAEWMTSEHNPLFARVIVNRLWHYHFGTGL
ncbi:MAG: DUF1549 domain-containing protein, partial [Planctomycetaceae bacterium]|nr:DUF1549 domain-containing protein [Planctomycetaceae bacterium]